MLRRPWTLWRSIAGQVWRLLLIAAPCVVATTALGAAVPPLSSGMLEVADALRYVLLVAPAMMVYALPFAAGFAATLVYHRLGTDNEAQAAYAGGISHRSLMVPAMATAIVLLGLMFYLSDQVVPRAVRETARMVARDVPKLIARGTRDGRSVQVQDLMIAARDARRLDPEPGSPALDTLVLTHFAAVRLGPGGEPTWEATAERAIMWLLPRPAQGPEDRGGTRAVVRLENAIALQEGRGVGGYRETVDLAFDIPDTFWDKASFMSLAQMRDARRRPESMNWIDMDRRLLASWLAARTTATDVDLKLRRDGVATLTGSQGRTVTIRGSSLRVDGEGFEVVPVAEVGDVGITVARPADAQGRASPPLDIRARGARLLVEPAGDALSSAMSLTLTLRDAVTLQDGRPGGERAALSFPNLGTDRALALRLQELPVRELVDLVRVGPHADPLSGLTDLLTRNIGRLERDLLAKTHERLALAVSSAVIVLTGAVMALRLSRRMPLAAYLWTFIPAVACWVTISGGQQLTQQMAHAGLPLLWGGVVALAVYTAAMYRGLIRH